MSVSPVVADSGSSESRVALVTGAAGIIGPTICTALKTSGWKVAALERSEEEFRTYAHIHGEPLPADCHLAKDLSSFEACGEAVREAEASLGPLGLLVHCATAPSRKVSFGEVSPDDCERLMRVDFLAPFYLAQAALESLTANRGSMIHLTSVRALHPIPGTMLYSSLKAGLEKMTECMALELLEKGVRVNAIRVGSIPGDAFLRPALKDLPPETAKALYDDVMRERMEAVTGPVRPGRPSDIAELILFLASPAGEYINGAVLPVDGAYTAQRTHESGPGGGRPDIVDRWKNHPEKELQRWLQNRKKS